MKRSKQMSSRAQECIPHLQEHRMELLGFHNGVDFINDSSSTNVNSAWYALSCVMAPVIWITGGVDKGNDYSILAPLIKEKVKYIIAVGSDNLNLHRFLKDSPIPIVNLLSMKEAVQFSFKLASKDFTILLSPGCSPCDLFENYEDRGKKFKKSVFNL